MQMRDNIGEVSEYLLDLFEFVEKSPSKEAYQEISEAYENAVEYYKSLFGSMKNYSKVLGEMQRDKVNPKITRYMKRQTVKLYLRTQKVRRMLVRMCQIQENMLERMTFDSS